MLQSFTQRNPLGRFRSGQLPVILARFAATECDQLIIAPTGGSWKSLLLSLDASHGVCSLVAFFSHHRSLSFGSIISGSNKLANYNNNRVTVLHSSNDKDDMTPPVPFTCC
jgi:hypothetical protein